MDVEHFLHNITDVRNIIAAENRQNAEMLADGFNFFDFIAPNEMRLSAILAWMLNPLESHGQGDQFLKAFLHYLDKDWPIKCPAHVYVAPEENASGRRLDVFVSCGDWVFGIENKAWGAPDLGGQVSDYLRFLKDKRGEYFLIYISGNGCGPKEISIGKDELDKAVRAGHLIIRSFPELIQWLEFCKESCRAHRVSVFLSEFERYIQQSFGKGQDVGDQAKMVESIIQGDDLVQSAMEVIRVEKLLKRTLAFKLVDQLNKYFNGALKASCQKNPGDKWFSWDIKYSEDHPFLLRFQFDDPNYKSLGYGLVKLVESQPEYPELERTLSKALGVGDGDPRSLKWWYWVKPASMQDTLFRVESNWEATSLPWKEISSNEMAKKMIAVADKFRGILQANDLL